MTDVLFIPQQGNVEPWLTDFLDAARGRVEVEVLDHGSPLGPQFAGVRIVVDQGGHGTPEMIDEAAATGVSLWQVLGTGLDHTDVNRILRRGLTLANTPGLFSATALAEHALLFILCQAKRLHLAERNSRAGAMYRPMSEELVDRVLAIVGFGASGRALAARARALGMRMHAVDVVPVDQTEMQHLGVERFSGLDELDDVLAGADYVSLHVPLTRETRHLIDARRLALMKPTATIVNVARGALIDEEALAEALRDDVIAAAGLDVLAREPIDPDDPLLALDNVFVTPHTAGFTRGTSRRRSEACVENALRVIGGDPPMYQVTASGWS